MQDGVAGRWCLHGGGPVAELQLDIEKWAQRNFGDCELGDARRTTRAVKLAAQVAAHPDGSTPEQTGLWADCKAAYRLFDRDEVTFEALCEPHWKQTRQRAAGTYLLIGDTTEISFAAHRDVSGLGPVGNGLGQGFLLHSSLMVDLATDQITGLAGAELFQRKPVPAEETPKQRKARARESEVWGRVIQQVGFPPPDARFIHVLDAGADNIEVYCHLHQQRAGWVIRVAQKHRIVLDESGERLPLKDHIAAQPLAGTYELSLRARKNQPARTATLEVRCASLSMPMPGRKTPFIKQCGLSEIPMTVVEAREVNAPKHVEPLHWVLLTDEPADDFDKTWTVLEWYERRPLVEEYHKCLKTGCRVEDRQYAAGERLARVTGLLSVVAVRLLQLKCVARHEPDRPAERVVPGPWLTMLRALRKGKQEIKTVGQFFRSLAMLGGFLARKRDGDPGWIVLWRGLKKLTQSLRGAEAMGVRCG